MEGFPAIDRHFNEANYADDQGVPVPIAYPVYAGENVVFGGLAYPPMTRQELDHFVGATDPVLLQLPEIVELHHHPYLHVLDWDWEYCCFEGDEEEKKDNNLTTYVKSLKDSTSFRKILEVVIKADKDSPTRRGTIKELEFFHYVHVLVIKAVCGMLQKVNSSLTDRSIHVIEAFYNSAPEEQRRALENHFETFKRSLKEEVSKAITEWDNQLRSTYMSSGSSSSHVRDLLNRAYYTIANLKRSYDGLRYKLERGR
jgi:hypothetical protein